MSVKNLVKESVRLLVHNQDAVSVAEVDDRGTMVYNVTVDKEDVGRVIGKDGRVVSSLRQVITAVGAKHRYKTVVKVNADS